MAEEEDGGGVSRGGEEAEEGDSCFTCSGGDGRWPIDRRGAAVSEGVRRAATPPETVTLKLTQEAGG